MLENLVRKIVQDFPEGISQTQIIRYVLDSGYRETTPGLLPFKIRQVVANLAAQKVLVRSKDQTVFGNGIRPSV